MRSQISGAFTLLVTLVTNYNMALTTTVFEKRSTDLADVDRILDGQFPLQGNLDPCALFAPPDEVEAEAIGLLERTNGIRHLFNLGHGVQPDTPYASVERLVQVVQGYATPSLPLI